MKPVSMRDLCTFGLDGRRLSNVNFDLLEGEVHVILSTHPYNHMNLCDLFTGEVSRVSGFFEINGLPWNHKNKEEIRIPLFGVDSIVFPAISVAQNITIAHLRPGLFVRNAALRRSLELMDEVGIHIDLTKPINKMSIDERKGIELLRICCDRPKVVVFHEATNNLTPDGRSMIPKALDWLIENGASIIYLTSNYEEGLEFGDRISVLDSGTIKGTFSIAEVRHNPQEIGYLLSGWKSLMDGGDEENLAVLNAITNISKIKQTEGELRRVFEHIAKDLVLALSAAGCVIYLLDDERRSVIDSFTGNEARANATLISNSDLVELLSIEAEVSLHHGQAKFHRLFGSNPRERSVVFSAVRMKGNKRALIQLMFERHTVISSQQSVYIAMFAREIAIAVETSRLLGNSVLLQETHHRIKNNLQMVHNLLYLKTVGQTADETGCPQDIAYNNEVLESAMNQIKCIATVHELLSRDWYGRNVVNMRHLVHSIVSLYESFGIKINLELDETTLPYNDAISLSLVTNELVSNACKHAFPIERPTDEIRISLINRGSEVVLIVSDNGIGMPSAGGSGTDRGTGTSIIQNIVTDMEGEMSTTTKRDKGTCVRVLISRKTIRPMVDPGTFY